MTEVTVDNKSVAGYYIRKVALVLYKPHNY